jgi:diguanylate cyclase (GGDEF)-like protein
MATAASPPIRNRSILDLLKQTVPLQDRAVELYRRLLAINALAAAMNVAGDIEQLKNCLAASIQEWMPDVHVYLCIIDGDSYRKVPLSASGDESEEKVFPLEFGLAGRALKKDAPLWIQDTHYAEKTTRIQACATDSLAPSNMVLPFSTFGKVLGCLELDSYQHNRFDEVEYHLGSLVAAQLSSSLENILTRQELAVANVRLRDHDQRLVELNCQLQQLAHTDEATGLYNKRRLFEQLNAEIARAKRYGEILSCLMLDLDHFKLVNDTYGHQAGDEVLRQIGALLRRRLRVTDFVARYGGEEFTVLLPRTDSSGARRVAESLRSAVKKHDFRVGAGCVPLTVSIGIACCTKFDRLDSQHVILRADKALYRAKAAGRDTICHLEETELSQEHSQEFVKEVKPA